MVYLAIVAIGARIRPQLVGGEAALLARQVGHEAEEFTADVQPSGPHYLWRQGTRQQQHCTEDAVWHDAGTGFECVGLQMTCKCTDSKMI